ncbi:hypothetical protein PsorP6_001796 [Peronosclerospora sorghi]|uniref:Uncharacterized protein n=1 Tax=Peronosclerospora sorghi TaxID=230839 RepID=A0ACC0WTJ7_9STRA|nr:hypothetical protein PsorP6_001796 [Peronosclerospora sorghi]
MFSIRLDAAGNIQQLKARLVDQGLRQMYGVYFWETYHRSQVSTRFVHYLQAKNKQQLYGTKQSRLYRRKWVSGNAATIHACSSVVTVMILDELLIGSANDAVADVIKAQLMIDPRQVAYFQSQFIQRLVEKFGQESAPVIYKSKRQRFVALLSAEAEYVALSIAAQAVLWLHLLTELGVGNLSSMMINVDNKAAIMMADHSGYQSRSKNIDFRYHFVRDAVTSVKHEIKYVLSD